MILGTAVLSGLPADPLRGELWIRADLLEITRPGDNSRETGTLSATETRALEVLLEDARWAVSGMIYGFDVTWTPSAQGRGVNEEFVVEPVAMIPRGDPKFRTVATHEENGFLFVTFEYSPDAVQQRRLEGWSGQTYPAASGAGFAPVLGWESRREAMNAAIRETIRAWLRVRDFNRPREISGRVAFLEFPRTGLSAGSIRADVSLRMNLKSIRPYAVD